ncbi:MAG: family peptidase [Phycisphaerales bacterium]|nr:family peptidase [Phycisphaerales bacterium]
MRAAVANGADAVYFGLDQFNARHRATNFTLEKLPEVMAYLHRHNVKGYLTFNVLIFSDELPSAVEYAKAMAAAKVDAVIVQDLGLALLLRELAPDLHVHGSTQMTLTEPRGVTFVKNDLGVRRVVLARELSGEDIGTIARATDVPLEVFIHGALCVAYSGQCLTSEALGGRSANRGQCAQACRLPYELIVDGTKRDLGDKSYLLSPQDLAAYDIVDDLVKAGVSCFKIEGRLKSAQYVAATTQTYRVAIDAAVGKSRFEISNSQKQNLAQVFSRGFTHGFLDGVDHSELVSALFPKSRGIRIGTVSGTTKRGVLVKLDRVSSNGRMAIDPGGLPLKPGDGVVFDEGHPDQDEQGGRIYEIFPRPAAIEIAFGTGAVNLKSIAMGALVWKTDDPEIRKRLEQSYARDEVSRRVPVTAVVRAAANAPLELTLSDAEGRSVTVTSQQALELARNQPLTLESLREQLCRLGDTPFELADVTAERLDAVMAPKSVLNDVRRRAVEQLLAVRGNAGAISIKDPDALDYLRDAAAAQHPESPTAQPSLTVLARTLDQLLALTTWRRTLPVATVYCDFEDVRKYADAVPIARDAGLTVALATTRIIKPNEEGLLRQVAAANPDAILVRNLAGLSFFREERPDLTLLGDYSLNIANELTAGLFLRAGLQRLVPSYDLNWKQLRAMLTRIDPAFFEAVIHQHMPMFHMEHCVFCHTLSNGKDYRDCGRPCDTHKVELKARDGQPHPLVADVGCRNTVFNASAQSALELVPQLKEIGVRHFRVELLRQDATETHALLTKYADVIASRADGRQTVRGLRVLSQLGVTRGTFDYE